MPSSRDIPSDFTAATVVEAMIELDMNLSTRINKIQDDGNAMQGKLTKFENEKLL